MTLDYRPISAMVQALPSGCRWTQGERDRWMKAMAAVVDLLVEVDDGSKWSVDPAVQREYIGRRWCGVTGCVMNGLQAHDHSGGSPFPTLPERPVGT